MSKVYIYQTEKAGTSIDILADDIAYYMMGFGRDVEIVSKLSADKANKNHVFLLQETAAPQFLEYFRYVKPKSLTLLHVSNPEMFAAHDWAWFMLVFERQHKGGSPLSVISYSPAQLEETHARLTKLFSPAVAKKIRNNVRFIPFGIRDEFAHTGTNDRTRWIVPYNRVENVQKNVGVHIEITQKFNLMAQLKKQPIPTHTFRYAPGFGAKEKHKGRFDLSVYELSPQPDTREEYMAEVGQYGMSLCTSLYESFGIYYLELLASGCVVVFLDKPWIRKLLPDYPFIASKAKLPDMLMSVYENWDQAHAFVTEKIRAEIDEKYRLKRFVSEVLDVIDGKHLINSD